VTQDSTEVDVSSGTGDQVHPAWVPGNPAGTSVVDHSTGA